MHTRCTSGGAEQLAAELADLAGLSTAAQHSSALFRVANMWALNEGERWRLVKDLQALDSDALYLSLRAEVEDAHERRPRPPTEAWTAWAALTLQHLGDGRHQLIPWLLLRVAAKARINIACVHVCSALRMLQIIVMSKPLVMAAAERSDEKAAFERTK